MISLSAMEAARMKKETIVSRGAHGNLLLAQ